MLLGDKIQCYALRTYTYNRLLDKGLKIKNKNKKKKERRHMKNILAISVLIKYLTPLNSL